MTTNSKSLILLQSLTCGICSNLFKDPNTLIPCGHVYCLDCLKTNETIKNCILCKIEYSSYIPNHPLKQMIDCLDQDNSNSNNTLNNNNNERINSIGSSYNNGGNGSGLIGFIEGLNESGGRRFSQQQTEMNYLKFSNGGPSMDTSNIRYCRIHFEEYYSFCEDCQCPVCPRCLLSSHNRHGMVPLTEESIAIKLKEYKEIEDSFKKKMSLYQENITIYKKEIELLDSSFQSCKMAIQLMISNLHKVLKTREANLLKEINSIHFNSHLELTDRSNTLESEIIEMEKLITNGTDRFKYANEIYNNQNLKFEFLEQFHISRTQSKKNITTELKPLYKTDLLFYKANSERVSEIINNTLGNISLLSFPMDDMLGEVNIWDEPKENIYLERVRINSNGVEEFEVKYGSLNKLIERLCQPNHYDDNYVNIFLLTYHSFCTSKKLLKKLIERFTIPEDLEAYNLTQANVHEIHMKIRALLVKWITEFSPQFDQDTINLFQNFNGRMQSEYTSIPEIENLLNDQPTSITTSMISPINTSQSLSSQSLTSAQYLAPIVPSLHFNQPNISQSCKIQNSPPQSNSPIFSQHQMSSSSSSSSPASPILNLNSLTLINGNDNQIFESPLNSPRSINISNASPRSSSFGASTATGQLKHSSNMFNSPHSPSNNSNTPLSPMQFMSSKNSIPSSKNLEFQDIDEYEIAKQLTLIEFETFKRIKPIDLLTCVDLKHKTPHITNIMERFNNISTWVSTAIVRAEHLKNRVKIMNKFIKIAEHLKNLNNFNSLTAILIAIQRSTTTRKELAKQNAKIISDLEKLMSSDEGYRQYRQRLSQCVPPCVPYVSVYLQDIMDLEKKNPPNVNVQITPTKSQEFINFSRRSLISKVILDLANYQRFTYTHITPILPIQEYLNVHIDEL